jgi:hypothetical protein
VEAAQTKAERADIWQGPISWLSEGINERRLIISRSPYRTQIRGSSKLNRTREDSRFVTGAADAAGGPEISGTAGATHVEMTAEAVRRSRLSPAFLLEPACATE